MKFKLPLTTVFGLVRDAGKVAVDIGALFDGATAVEIEQLIADVEKLGVDIAAAYEAAKAG